MNKTRLRWACRRGMLELDLLLLPFLETVYDQLSAEEQQDFQVLLAAQDQDLFAWLLGKTCPENPAFVALIARIKAHVEA